MTSSANYWDIIKCLHDDISGPFVSLLILAPELHGTVPLISGFDPVSGGYCLPNYPVSGIRSFSLSEHPCQGSNQLSPPLAIQHTTPTQPRTIGFRRTQQIVLTPQNQVKTVQTYIIFHFNIIISNNTILSFGHRSGKNLGFLVVHYGSQLEFPVA